MLRVMARMMTADRMAKGEMVAGNLRVTRAAAKRMLLF